MEKKKVKTTSDLRRIIQRDQGIRRVLARQSHYWFFHVFFGHYIQHETAPFQQELFWLTERDDIKLLVVMAFRGSGKSTILNLSYALWSILGVRQKKFVVIISRTGVQAEQRFKNIRDELENNDLLHKDLGPFRTDEAQWGRYGLELIQTGAKIISVSREHSIRGLRYGQIRPDLIICDDIEDAESVDSETEREKTQLWFESEVVPSGQNNTHIVVIGNLLHQQSLLMELRRQIKEGKRQGIFRTYPLLDEDGKVLWPGQFQTPESITALQQRMGEDAWDREYMLSVTIIVFFHYWMNTRRSTQKMENETSFQKPLIPAMKLYRIAEPTTEAMGTKYETHPCEGCEKSLKDYYVYLYEQIQKHGDDAEGRQSERSLYDDDLLDDAKRIRDEVLRIHSNPSDMIAESSQYSKTEGQPYDPNALDS